MCATSREFRPSPPHPQSSSRWRDRLQRTRDWHEPLDRASLATSRARSEKQDHNGSRRAQEPSCYGHAKGGASLQLLFAKNVGVVFEEQVN